MGKALVRRYRRGSWSAKPEAGGPDQSSRQSGLLPTDLQSAGTKQARGWMWRHWSLDSVRNLRAMERSGYC